MLLLRDDDVNGDDSVDDDGNTEEDGTTDDGRREGGVKECIDNGRSRTRSNNNDVKSIVRIVDVVVRLLLANNNRPRPLLVIQQRGGRSLDVITAW